jgi:hypothetical protein
LKTASNFFDVASLNVTVAGGTAVDQALLANTCNFSTLVTPFVCNATSGHTAALQRAYDKITVACMQAGISTSEAPPTPPQQVAEGKFTTQTEQHMNQKAADFKLKNRLILVSLDKDNQVVLPALNPALDACYKEKNAVAACQVMTDAYHDYNMSAIEPVLGMRQGSYDFTEHELYPVFVKAVLEGKYHSDNLRYHPEYIKKSLNIFNFLKPNKTSYEYTQIVQDGQKTMAMVAISPGRNDIAVNSTDLYCGGSHVHVEDVLTALANIEGFLAFLLDPDTLSNDVTPVVITFLRHCYERLAKLSHKRMVTSITSGPQPNLYFGVNHLLDIQQGLAQIFKFAHNPSVKILAGNGGDISAAFDKMQVELAAVVNNMDVTFSTGNFTNYLGAPPIIAYLAKVSGGKKHPNDNGKGGGGGAGGGGDSPNKQGKEKKIKPNSPNSVVGGGGNPNGNADQLAKFGMIKHVRDEKTPPVIPVHIQAVNTNKNNTLTKICRNFITVGLKCKHESCSFAHLTTRNFHKHIPDVQHQKDFCEFVNQSTDFTWSKNELKPKSQ